MTFTITACSLIKVACWLIGVGLAVAEIFLRMHLGALSICFVSTAAVLTIKGFLDAHAGNWTQAYEIGREVAKVRRIR